MSIISEISEFNLKDHPKVVKLYEKITKDKQITRNGAIHEILINNLSPLEQVILAMNLGEFKAKENQEEQLNQIIETTSKAMERMLGMPAKDIQYMVKESLKKDDFLEKSWIKKIKKE